MAEPDITFSLAEVLKAQAALRVAANLPTERFPIEAFVGMISDEMDALRQAGYTDEQIAGLIRQSSSIAIDPDTLARHYAPPEQRRR